MSHLGVENNSVLPTAANRLGLDYRAEAGRMSSAPVRIIDAHTHINGGEAAKVFLEAMDLYGIERTYSQTQLAQADAVLNVLGDRIRFVAIPSYMDPDRERAHREGFLENIQLFHDRFGARIVKFWAAPRWRDYWDAEEDHDVYGLESEWRIRAAELAQSLGMMLMAHVGDPDTWFATRYADSGKYGTKAEQYEPFERMLDRFDSPWLAAHMGGWPEDLEFLSGLLSRHDNLYLDTSATKWMVRELSKHTRAALVSFFETWSGRVLFGTDIVTMDEHLLVTEPDPERTVAHLADSHESAFDLYASRYWAMRVLFETDYEGESPIADPDLAMVEPERFDAMDAPRLVGKSLGRPLLEVLYRGAAEGLFDRIESSMS